MKNNKNDKVINAPLTQDTLSDNKSVSESSSANLPAKANNKSLDKNKGKDKKESGFVRFFKRIGRAFKGMVEELKKVTWPTFATTLKSTGIVLIFVVVFLAVLMAMDALFGLGFSSLIGIQG